MVFNHRQKKRKPPAARPPLQAGKTKKAAAKQSSSSYISSESVDTNEATNAMEYEETVTEEQRQDTQISKENGLPKELGRKLLILEKELREIKHKYWSWSGTNIWPSQDVIKQTIPEAI